MKKNINKILIAALVVTAVVLISSCSDSQYKGKTPAPGTQPVQDAMIPLSTVTQTENTAPEFPTDIDLSDVGELTYSYLLRCFKETPLLRRINAPQLTLTSNEYQNLCAVNPSAELITKISFETAVLDLSANEVDISNSEISDKAAFDSLLSCLPSGIKLVMSDCGYSNEQMAALREKYPELDFAWKLYLGEKWTLRTDDEAFSVMIYDYDYTRMTSADIEVLKYCTNMHALDLGHQAITDLSVLGTLSELRILILADNKVSDLTPLKNLKKLEYLELFVNRVSDVSPLSECTELVDLNIGWNRSIKDISAIYSLSKIERLWLPTTGIKADKHSEITDNFPNAKIIFADVDSISSGWRTHPRYRPMRATFTNNKYDPNFTSYKE